MNISNYIPWGTILPAVLIPVAVIIVVFVFLRPIIKARLDLTKNVSNMTKNMTENMFNMTGNNSNSQQDNTDHINFCPYCGAKAHAEHSFCKNCGKEL